MILFLVLISHIAHANSSNLMETYEDIEESLLNNIYDIPIHLKSSKQKNTMRGDVYSIIYHPFKVVSESLTSATNWCKIMPLHLNIKACTYQLTNQQCRLTFYTGRKFYEKADHVYRLNYQFKIYELNDDYFNASLIANTGPIGTKDYNIIVEAIPLTNNSTFFHLSYEYKFGFFARVAMASYFATLGHDKIGFTIKEKDNKGNPVYVKGIRGVIERNSIRYYFAILSFLNTRSTQVKNTFKERINSWFDFTEKHHSQLYEMDKKDYIKYKNMERKDQSRLQKATLDIGPEKIVAFNKQCRLNGKMNKSS